jgi:hypothetical protein
MELVAEGCGWAGTGTIGATGRDIGTGALRSQLAVIADVGESRREKARTLAAGNRLLGITR